MESKGHSSSTSIHIRYVPELDISYPELKAQTYSRVYDLQGLVFAVAMEGRIFSDGMDAHVRTRDLGTAWSESAGMEGRKLRATITVMIEI
ncbi:hypothetical protein HS088_TW08G00610 [Tripterygium wilfordii]|uniref:Uncharacterized protein n=1 Tax=Tripterygium wilfordii TaxID=458696 RepID=A0A7J7DCH5_TRIWF|nr:hypothetical protein HS088_TW08G00610 [Tripterygium wilfordii]